MSSAADAAVWRPPQGATPGLDLALWNVLMSYLGVALPIGPKRTCRFEAVVSPGPDGAAARLRLSSGQDVIVVPVAFPFAAAHGADVSVADLPVLPPVLRDALTEGIVSLTAAAMPFSGPPEVAALGPLSALEAGRDWPWFRATLDGIAPEPVVVDATASPTDLRAVFGGAPLRRVRNTLAAQLDRPVHATLARMRVTLSALRGWREGTVVVFDGPAEGRPLKLRAAARRFDFEARGGAWLCGAVDEVSREERSAMAGNMAEKGRAAVDLDALELDVDFDLGRSNVPLTEIEGWQVGSLVPLPDGLTGETVAVTLRVNGRAVGTGDIVTIDGRLAVRLSALAV